MQQRTMNEPEWQDRAEKVLRAISGVGLSGHSGMARALGELARLLDDAPSGYIKRHATAKEAEFTTEQTAAQARLLQDDHTIVFSDIPAQLLLRVAAQITALDVIHHQLVGTEPPADPNQDWRVSIESGEIFLIPRRRLYRLSSRSSAMRDLSRRDLMPLHRILPTRLGPFDVRLEWRDLAATWPPTLKLGGVLFPELKFLEDKSDDSFLVVGVVCAGQDAQVAGHLEAAHTEQCAAAVFPELTIDLAVRRKLQQHLQDRLLWAKEKPQSCPSVVVAGSWHEADGEGNHVNVATVFDAYGEEILRHEKMLPYRDPERRPERIKPGTTVNVLVTEEVLIAFGICLDFCERDGGAPFPALDVDYALVPSCGNNRTMEGHLATAKDMAIRFRSRGFVVQQAHPELPALDGRKPLGYILDPTSKLDILVTSTLAYEPWNVRTAA